MATFQCPFLNFQSYRPASPGEDVYMDAVEMLEEEDSLTELFHDAPDSKFKDIFIAASLSLH